MRLPPSFLFLVISIAVFPLLCLAEDTGRTKTRLLFSFENPGEVEQLLTDAEPGAVDIIAVQDNCVTEGTNCARVTCKKGGGYCGFTLGKEVIKNWGDFDYFAMDLYTEDTNPYDIVFELWDQASKNYHTRCTFESQGRTHPGKQTVMWQINRAKRNNKEGRTWPELEPQDKIDMNNLKMVKIFLVTLKDRDAVFWIDNLRLLQEDAAKPKMKVWLPDGALAFDFGSAGATVPGFKAVDEKTLFSEEKGYGLISGEGVEQGGLGWPDLLSGKFIWSPSSAQIDFKAAVPDGEYFAWLCAGKVIRPDLKNRHYLLKINDTVLFDETPSYEQFCSESYMYRFMWTQYSEKQNAVWRNYIDKMYPVVKVRLTVAGGAVSVSAVNHFVSALILVPAAKEADFDRMVSELTAKRIDAFYKSFYAPEKTRPQRAPEDGSFVLYVPDSWTAIYPGTGPSALEKARTGIKAAGAPGQRIVMRTAVVPFEDLGKCTLSLADMTGAGTIPAANIRGYYQSYRSTGAGASVDALLPSLSLEMEKGITQCYWLWMQIPVDAAAGIYRGSFTFSTTAGKTAVPVELEVYPFKLEDTLPVSYGFYYGGPSNPQPPEDVRRQKIKEQLELMREFGLTAVPVGGPRVTKVDVPNRKVALSFDTLYYELAKEVGMAKSPEQQLMANQLGMARSIGRALPGSIGAKVDQSPGLELKQPEFKDIYTDGLRQYKQFLDSMNMPVAVEVVDEPREVPNPWNRNLADTIAYADMMKQAGIPTFCTPMGDGGGGLDYTVLAQHLDIVSVHAYPGSKGQIEQTRKNGKTLWFYNTGKDRFSWGFYNWKMDSKGRWEWHFNWEGDGDAVGGYPCDEWYNPFVARNGRAASAPYTKYRGAILFRGDFLDICEGVNDYAYICTLQKAIEANVKAGKNAALTKEAQEFLAALKKAIPEFPHVKGMASEADGALVGMGIEDEAAQKVDEWRAKIAEYLRKLK